MLSIAKKQRESIELFPLPLFDAYFLYRTITICGVEWAILISPQ